MFGVVKNVLYDCNVCKKAFIFPPGSEKSDILGKV